MPLSERAVPLFPAATVHGSLALGRGMYKQKLHYNGNERLEDLRWHPSQRNNNNVLKNMLGVVQSSDVAD